jgi:hypothetical protein
MLEKIDSNQEKAGTNRKIEQEERKQEIRTGLERTPFIISRMDACQGRIMACLGKMGATDLNPNPEEREFAEVSTEQTAVNPVGGLRKRHRSRNLATERHRKPKDGFGEPAERWPTMQKSDQGQC